MWPVRSGKPYVTAEFSADNDPGTYMFGFPGVITPRNPNISAPWYRRRVRGRVVLIHGAATTSRVWRHVVPLLGAFDVACPDRACSGSLAAEVTALRGACSGAVVAGVSGGGTLGLALAAAGVPMTAAVLHEPAAGSLYPGLLDAVRAAYQAGGVAGFGRALYGPAWTPAEAPDDPGAVARDLAMFSAFEPVRPAPGAAGPVVLTVGERSPRARHESVRRLAEALGCEVRQLPDAHHAVHLDHPGAFAAAIREQAGRAAGAFPSVGTGGIEAGPR
jgi:pimeloyl-ACP methyl ester carboxylesterase